MIKINTFKDLATLKRHIKAGDDVLVEAYRITTARGTSYYFPERKPKLITKKGRVLRVKRPDRNPMENCGAGVNVATMRWCIDRTRYAWSRAIWAVRFRTGDVACIPKWTDGKFRLSRCKVVRLVKKAHYGRVVIRL